MPSPYNEVLHTIAARRAVANEQERPAIGATDVYAGYFGTDNEARALHCGQRAVNFLLQQGRDGPYSAVVRTSLTQALEAVSPRFRLALRHQHHMDGFLLQHACAVGVASGWLGGAEMPAPMSAPSSATIAAHARRASQLTQALQMVWPERLITERAALRYSRALDKPTLQILSGPLGEALVAIKAREAEYLPQIVNLSPHTHQDDAEVPLTAAENTRLRCIVAYRTAAGADVDAGFLAQINRRPNALRNVYLRAARLWLQMFDGIDVEALHQFFTSPRGRKYRRQTRRLDAKHAQDIAAALAAAQRQVGSPRGLGL